MESTMRIMNSTFLEMEGEKLLFNVQRLEWTSPYFGGLKISYPLVYLSEDAHVMCSIW
jgi:hypothetical protein